MSLPTPRSSHSSLLGGPLRHPHRHHQWWAALQRLVSTFSTRNTALTTTRTRRYRGPTKRRGRFRASPSATRTQFARRGPTSKLPDLAVRSAAAFPRVLAAHTLRMGSTVGRRWPGHVHRGRCEILRIRQPKLGELAKTYLYCRGCTGVRGDHPDLLA